MWKELLEQETLSKKLITKWFRAYFFVMFTAPLWYLIRLLASNTLTVSDVWIFYWVLSLMTLLSTYNDLGLTEAMQYFLPKYRLEWKRWQIKNTIWLSFFVQMITWILIFALLFLNADWLAINHFHAVEAAQVIRIMSFYFLWNNVIQVCNQIFVSFQDTQSSWIVQFSNLISVFLFSIVFWIWASFNLSFFALARIIWIISGIWVWVCILLKKYKHLFKLERDDIDKDVLKTQFKYALRVFLTSNVWVLLWNVDQQLVLNKLWVDASGYFTNTLSLLNIFISVVSPFLWLLFPVATELSTRKEQEKFKMLESMMYTHFAFLAIVVWWTFLVFWEEIGVLLYGEKFRFSWELLQILWPCLIFNCLNSLNFYLLAWLWKIKQRFVILLISLIVNVTCNVIALFVLNLGLRAVVCVLALSWLVSFIWWLIVVKKEHPFTFDRKFFLKNLILISIMCLILWIMKNKFTWFYEWQSRWHILFILAWICVIYAWMLAIVNRWKIKFLIWEIKNLKANS